MRNLVLTDRYGNNTELIGYSDSDNAEDRDDWKLTSGYVFMRQGIRIL
jgi:hypothetical protein